MTDEHLRRRADTFLATGPACHRLRPPYPDAAVDWMLQPGARDVLDLGAGTGRLTDALVERGLAVSAVDPSASMLGVLAARHPGVRAVSGAAEATGLPDASFDAIVVAQAWHWVDADAASAEAARLLRPGGTLAMVWNQRELVDEWQAAFDAVQHGVRGVDLAQDADARPPFGPREQLDLTWEREVSPEDFLELYTTHSPFLVLDADARAERLARWRALLEQRPGATVTERYRTEARRYRLLAP